MIFISGLLFPLAVIGGIAYLIVTLTRGRRERDQMDRADAISIRRLFQYALLLAALLVAASGVTGVLSRIISDAAARRGSELAGPLALTVSGVPVFWFLGRWIWRQLGTDPKERNSIGWSLYLNAALIGSLVTAVGAAFGIADGFVSGDGYDGTKVAPFLVAVAVWWGHWVVSQRIRPAVLEDLHILAGSAVGLGSMAGGAGFVIGVAIDKGFDRARGVDVSRFFGDDIAMAVVAIGIGAVVWGWHWLYNWLRAERTTLWHVYVILFGILGGLVTAVIGGATALFLVLQWLFGDPGSSNAAAHFQDASPAFAAGLVGATVWLYHKSVLGFQRSSVRSDIDRIYDYLVSGVALATVAGALTTLIVAMFSVFGSNDVVSDGESDVNIVVAAITLLLVGGPLWAINWRNAQRALAADRQEESAAPARRIYLFAVFGIGGAVAFGALTRLVFVLFAAVLGERSGGSLADDTSIPIALLLTTGAIAAYHWSVFQAERTAVEPPQPRRDVTLIWAGGDPNEISRLTNVRLHVIRRTDDAASADTREIVAAIDHTEGERLVVIAGPDGATAIPVESR